MKSTDIPTKFPIPFAADAAAGYTRQVPEASQITIQAGAASLTDGFPPVTFLPVGAGGTPPWGQDFNGLLNQISAWSQWQSAGGPLAWDSSFSAAIGGYPKGAVVASTTFAKYWLSTVDDNVTNPDASGAGWQSYLPVPLNLANGECILSYLSATQITLLPKNGNNIIVNGAQRQIASGGVVGISSSILINGTLQAVAANTDYLVAYNESDALELWSLATGHSADTTAGNVGIEVITGHPTKSLVGMVGTNASSQFSNFLTLSWFNRGEKANATAFTTTRSVTGTSFVEINSEIRNTFLVWAGDIIKYKYAGAVFTAVGGSSTPFTGIGFDGIAAEPAGSLYEGFTGNTAGNAGFSGAKTGLSEGRHYATLLGYQAVSGRADWFATPIGYASVLTIEARG